MILKFNNLWSWFLKELKRVWVCDGPIKHHFFAGNYYGEGEIRKNELLHSCKQLGVNESHCTIIDDRLV